MPYEAEDREQYERNSAHAIAAAVVAERERCARIAENGYLISSCTASAAKNIADAIRNSRSE